MGSACRPLLSDLPRAFVGRIPRRNPLAARGALSTLEKQLGGPEHGFLPDERVPGSRSPVLFVDERVEPPPESGPARPGCRRGLPALLGRLQVQPAPCLLPRVLVDAPPVRPLQLRLRHG